MATTNRSIQRSALITAANVSLAKTKKYGKPAEESETKAQVIAEEVKTVSTPVKKVEPKVEVKTEPKVEAKVEIKAEPKVEPKVEIKAEPKVEAKAEAKPEPQVIIKETLDSAKVAEIIKATIEAVNAAKESPKAEEPKKEEPKVAPAKEEVKPEKEIIKETRKMT